MKPNRKFVRAWAAFDEDGNPIANTVATERSVAVSHAYFLCDDDAPIGRVLVVDDRPEKKGRRVKE